MHDALREEKSFRVAVEECKEWLKLELDKIRKIRLSTGGSLDELGSKLQITARVMSEQDNGTRKVQSVNESGQKLLSYLPIGQQKARIEREITEISETWNNLQDELKTVSDALNVARSKWSTYDDEHAQLVEWLSKAEREVELLSQTAGDLPEKKTQVERSKIFLKEIEDQEIRLAKIKATTCSFSENENIRQNIIEIGDKLERIHNQANMNSQAILKAYETHLEYRNELNEFQRWLLNVSARLGEINTLGAATSLTKAEQQLNRQDIISTEISAQIDVLDFVQEKANNLCILSTNHPTLIKNVRTQITEIEESLSALDSTSLQLKVCPCVVVTLPIDKTQFTFFRADLNFV